jgi:hypothetical protein
VLPSIAKDPDSHAPAGQVEPREDARRVIQLVHDHFVAISPVQPFGDKAYPLARMARKEDRVRAAAEQLARRFR